MEKNKADVIKWDDFKFLVDVELTWLFMALKIDEDIKNLGVELIQIEDGRINTNNIGVTQIKDVGDIPR